MPRFSRTLASLAIASGALAPLAFGVAPAQASHTQIAMFEEDGGLKSNPDGTMDTLSALGVGMVRVTVNWSSVAPSATSSHKPRFNDRSDTAYPSGAWATYDRIVAAAQRDHMLVDLDITGGEPIWAAGPSIPSNVHKLSRAWKPQSKLYGNFVAAVAHRYRGAVALWELFNEPNFGQDLAPQGEHGGRQLDAPANYRGLVDAGYSALHSAHVASTSIVVGQLAARGNAAPGELNQTKPLLFIRALYCVDGSLRALRGSAAAAVGCPRSPSRAFARQHPGLFQTSFGIHPYPQGLPPTQDTASDRDPDFVTFRKLGTLERTLDGIQRTYGSHHRAAVYNSEYGYVTNPPAVTHRNFASPANAAIYLNQAEYLSWRDPRIVSTMQFLLQDPPVGGPSQFFSGLESAGGKPKVTLAAYRMPLWLPNTKGRKGRRLEVWGDVRPAHVYPGTQIASIQFAPGSSSHFATVATVTLRDPHGYFDVGVAFPASGKVRLAWTYPGGAIAYSRTSSISIH